MSHDTSFNSMRSHHFHGVQGWKKIYMEIKVSTQTYLYWLAKFQSIQTLIDQNIVNKSKVCVGESVCKPNSTTTLQRSDIMQILVVINAVIVFYNKNVKKKKCYIMAMTVFTRS